MEVKTRGEEREAYFDSEDSIAPQGSTQASVDASGAVEGNHGVDQNNPGGVNGGSTADSKGFSSPGGENTSFVPREDLNLDVLRSLSEWSAEEICREYEGETAWTTWREERFHASSSEGFRPCGWFDLWASARFDARLPREIVLSPYPLRGDATLLGTGTRIGSSYRQRHQGRDCFLKVLFPRIPSEAIQKGEVDTRSAELQNETRIYGHLEELQARESVPAYYWQGDLQPGFAEALVVEYVEGSPLESRADFLAAASLIHELHERGVLHRDVHIGNFLVSSKTKRPVVFDFGFGKLRHEDFDGEEERWRQALRRERASLVSMLREKGFAD